MIKAVEFNVNMSQNNFAGLMMGSTELRDFFLAALHENSTTWMEFTKRLDEMVKSEEITTFDHDQIMDHLKDNMTSQFMSWQHFQYALKALGAKSIKIVVE
jgi:hypothetical protein